MIPESNFMANDNKNKPNFPDESYERMANYLKRADDLTRGVEAMRAGGYLKIHRFETLEQFAVRVDEAVLKPAFADVVDEAVGMVFREEPKLSGDVNVIIAGRESKTDADGKVTQEPIEGQWENIDNAGTHWVVFWKEAFDWATRYGHCVVLTENSPPLPLGSDGQQEIDAARRPWCVKYKPQQVRHPRVIVERSKKVLQSITFIEKNNEPDGDFGTKEVIRYRVYRRDVTMDESGKLIANVTWQLWEEVEDEKGQIDVEIVDDGDTGLQTIPCYPIYGDQVGDYESQPPYLHLIDLNIAHYRGDGDLRQMVSFCQFPLLVPIGRANDSAPIPAGAAAILDVPIGGSASYVSPTADGANIGRLSQQDLEQQMASASTAVRTNQIGRAHV